MNEYGELAISRTGDDARQLRGGQVICLREDEVVMRKVLFGKSLCGHILGATVG